MFHRKLRKLRVEGEKLHYLIQVLFFLTLFLSFLWESLVCLDHDYFC